MLDLLFLRVSDVFLAVDLVLRCVAGLIFSDLSFLVSDLLGWSVFEGGGGLISSGSGRVRWFCVEAILDLRCQSLFSGARLCLGGILLLV
ncbi:hypothetical protein Bca4012_067548 [Brassica carinata]